ncbi:MAG: NEW3 domain-containing protein [Candidatus Aenigmarchaeota archaeon]|nr:NEW3 domain-containing protein [Candidatus Aenigmarchaeota archaeon]MDW8160216.1 NEW3 domain-containing protein [Candidatus Aenigmarchaeota archaeon]
MIKYVEPMITGFFIGFGEPTNATWFNTSWHYRFRVEITSNVERSNWPVEIEVNFSELLPYGTFDENSIRVFEYSSNGNLLYEVPSQFEKSENYSSSNAVGELVFLLNGTTLENQKRIFYVYYDSLENGPKEERSYQIPFYYQVSEDKRFVNINTTDLAFYIDTSRLNYSGIYKVVRKSDGIEIVSSEESEKPIEYTELYNGTHVLTFDLRNNFSLFLGPVRSVLIQEGPEVESSTFEKTKELSLVKKYYFYNTNYVDGSYVRVKQVFSNLANYYVSRESTPAGALTLEVNRSFFVDPNYIDCDYDNPNSYCLAGAYGYGYAGGVVNLNSSPAFFATNETETLGRIGLHLNRTDLASSAKIFSDSLLYFGAYGDVGASQIFHTIRLGYANPLKINISKPEKIFVNVSISTNATIYNRNEGILIEVNVTNDPYRLARFLNATFDFGTLEESDDVTIRLYDDGTHGDKAPNDKIYTNTFVLPTNAKIGTWRINVTIYDKDYVYLDSAEHRFNVTNILNVRVFVLNKILMEGRTNYAFLNVLNFRNDSYLKGAEIVCRYGDYLTTNFTDYLNGSYLVNFTNPPYGYYSLVCNATKDGNFGWNEDSFFSQAAKTQVEIVVTPTYLELKNVSFYSGETFGFYVNLTNIGNGIAYSANVSFEIPENWTTPRESKECGNIGLRESCYKYFTITTEKNSLGNFSVNVTIEWENPDGTKGYNKTNMTVNILPNPILRVDRKILSGIAKDGLSVSLGSVTIFSEGNYNLTNIVFSCVAGPCEDFNFSYIPSTINVLRPGESSLVRIYVETPLGYSHGIHNLTINVSSEKVFDVFNVSIILQPKTNVSIRLSPSFYNTQKITIYSGDSFEFTSLVENIQNSSARNLNISLSLPSGWSSNRSLEYCGDLRSSENCSKSFNVYIPPSTSPGIYYVRVYVNWTNLDRSISFNQTIFTVTVLANPLIDVLEKEISRKVPPSQTSYLGNITVISVGNERIRNVSFSCVDGCGSFSFTFHPMNFDLDSGRNRSVMVNVTVPFNYLAGAYNVRINVSSSNSLNFAIFNLTINVSENRTWDASPRECRKSEYPSEGIACVVNVRNLGNANITFFVSPVEGNYTKVENTTFVVGANKSFDLLVSYNVSGVPEGIYISNFTIFAVETDAYPSNLSFSVILLPFTPPDIVIYFDKEEIEQNTSIRIFANVTDRGSSGIKKVTLIVFQPNMSYHSLEMNFSYSQESTYVYFADYPFKHGGDTLQVGHYNATVYVEDNIGNYNYNSKLFRVRKSYISFVSTLSSVYYQGDSGSIYFVARDFENKPLGKVEVNIKIFDPAGRVIHDSNHVTNKDGTISPIPSFYLPSDSLIGNYTVVANSSYKDSDIVTVKLANSTFSVIKRAITVTGLFADISTAVVWYPNNVMKFGILVYDGEGKPVDPDTMNLTVYDPAGNLYLSVNFSQMRKESTGFYSYRYAMPPTTPNGMYLAVLNVSKGEFQTMKLASFRVAQGGPYDVKVIPLEYEVAQGEELDFNILIINMGEVSQDVFIEYWVSSPDGTKYFQSSEAVFTPALTNKTFLRNAYIFSNQPLGLYYINVKVTYDYVQPPIIANATFIVIAKNVTQVERPIVEVPIPTGQMVLPVPVPVPTANLTAGLMIEKFARNVSVARNAVKTEVVVVRNIGGIELGNVSLTLVGIPLAWFNITPSNYYKLKPNETAVFVITFNIPKNANTGVFPVTLIASSNLIADSKEISITIYKSIEELLEEEISKLEDEYADLVIKAKIAEKEGKDVSVVNSLLEKIKEELRGARISLHGKNYEDASKKVENVKTMIERVKDLLSKLQIKQRVFIIPIWPLVSLLGVSFLIFLVFYTKFRKKEKVRLPVIISTAKLAEMVKAKESRENILREREEVLRALKALEKSRKENIISEEAYRAMKRTLEEKLDRIEKKIK